MKNQNPQLPAGYIWHGSAAIHVAMLRLFVEDVPRWRRISPKIDPSLTPAAQIAAIAPDTIESLLEVIEESAAISDALGRLMRQQWKLPDGVPAPLFAVERSAA